MYEFIKKYNLHFIPFIFLIMLFLLIRMRLSFSYSFDNDGLEYYFVHVMQRIMLHKPIYPNPESFPFENCLCTPIYPYLCSIIIGFFKLDAITNLYKTYVLIRLFSYVLVLAQLYYLIKLIKFFTASKFHQVLITALFLFLITGHIFCIRPDALKLLFFSVFLYHLINYFFFKQKTRDAFIAVCSAVLAVYTKQDITIHIFLCFGILLFLADKRKVLILAVSFGFICFICFILCFLIFGKYVFSNLVLFNLQSVTEILKSYNIYFIIFSIIRTFPLLILVILNLKTLKKETDLKSASGFIVLCSLVFYIYSHLSILRAAANLNYTYELLIFLVLNIALFLKLHTNKINQKLSLSVIILAGYIALLAVSNAIIQNYSMYEVKEQQFKKEYFASVKESKTIKELIGKEAVFLPNSKYMIFYADANMVTGHDMHIDRFIILYASIHIYIKSKLTVINTDGYDSNFTNGTIKYIVIPKDSKSRKHVADFYPKYKAYSNTDNFLVYQFDKNSQ